MNTLAITATNDHVGSSFPSALVVTALRGNFEVVDRIADEWRELCTEATDDQPFYRPEFIRAHIRSVIPSAKVVLITARLQGRLRLVLPLVEELGSFSKVPVRRLRAPVNFNCGRFDAVCAKGPEGDAAITSTWNFLRNYGSWDMLYCGDTTEGGTISRLAEIARADGFLTIRRPNNPNPIVPVPSDPELLKKMPLNARLRTKLRQVRRQMNEESPLSFYRVTTADHVALQRFYELEASGWKGRNGSDILHDGSRMFFDELAEVAARYGYLSLYMLEWKGQLIAGHFALTYEGHCYSPKVAYNEAFKQFAPGHLIVSEMLQDCAARGIHTYDITGECQEWKMKWTDEMVAMNHHFIFRGAVGRLAYSVNKRLKLYVNSRPQTDAKNA